MKKLCVCGDCGLSRRSLLSAGAVAPFDGSWEVIFRDTIEAHAIGSARASVAVQDEHSSGSGKLTIKSGHGAWRGYSGSARCSGHWTAQRNRSETVCFGPAGDTVLPYCVDRSPMMIMPTMGALCWKLLLDPSHGVTNQWIGHQIVWLGRPDTALASVWVVGVWQSATYVHPDPVGRAAFAAEEAIGGSLDRRRQPAAGVLVHNLSDAAALCPIGPIWNCG